jgi:hypothetical protein
MIPENVGAWMLAHLRQNTQELIKLSAEREKDGELYQAYQLNFLAECYINITRRLSAYLEPAQLARGTSADELPF